MPPRRTSRAGGADRALTELLADTAACSIVPVAGADWRPTSFAPGLEMTGNG